MEQVLRPKVAWVLRIHAGTKSRDKVKVGVSDAENLS